MNEDFLHFIWQYQRFNTRMLMTTAGETIHVFKPGIPNYDSGPDFFNAHLKIGQMEWYGNVEVHLKASSWNAHDHHHDQGYDNVILHVVWEEDRKIFRKDKTEIPTLELKSLTDQELQRKYYSFISRKDKVVCASNLASIPRVHKVAMADKTLIRRLEAKAGEVKKLLLKNNMDWEETAYQVLARNFGFKVNSEPFFRLSQSVPLKVLLKNRGQLFSIEALLFGQAGMLKGGYKDEYARQLKKEFGYLSHKYELPKEVISLSEWKFMRMRPGNFPTVRLAEFAALINAHASLFSAFTESAGLKELREMFRIKLSTYWEDHYLFDKKTGKTLSGIGLSSVDNIIINTVVPLLVCYSKEKHDTMFLDKAIGFLEALPGEQNRITRLWESAGLVMKTAADTQAGIEMYNAFCKNKLCMSCNIGVNIIKS